jgi:hypothetical protein
MKPYRLLVIALALVFGQAPWLGAADDLPESPYYPLKVGNKWEYQIKGQGVTITARVAKHEKVGDVPCALVETVVDDKVVATEHIGADKDGVYRHAVANMRADPPVRFLKLPPKKGDTWKVDSKVQGQSATGTFTLDEEEITVPAGKYQAVVSRSPDFAAAGQKVATAYWFASGVGVVRQQVNVGGNDVMIELVKFEAGK